MSKKWFSVSYKLLYTILGFQWPSHGDGQIIAHLVATVKWPSYGTAFLCVAADVY
jgi:hypothetical protein